MDSVDFILFFHKQINSFHLVKDEIFFNSAPITFIICSLINLMIENRPSQTQV